jgi:hypothetical protein
MDDAEATNLLPSTTFADGPIRATLFRTSYHLTAAPGHMRSCRRTPYVSAFGPGSGLMGLREVRCLDRIPITV